MNVCGTDVKIQGRLLRIARVAAEGFEFIEDPDAARSALQNTGTRIDLFTFMQKLPHVSPEYDYPMEWDNVAALPVSTFEHWWTHQIDGKTRNMVRRSEKKGVVVREVSFDDALANGIWEIYNECPVRQGRPFPHYGKDPETVRKMSATFLETSIFIGAFLSDRLIGFVKLTTDEARSQAAVMHIIAMVQHRDKAPTNALIAGAVQSCEKRSIPYLVYSNFAYGKKQRDSLSDFKENNGFRRFDLPRYYVPLNLIGDVAFRLGLHHSVFDRVPEPILAKFRELRNAWYRRKVQTEVHPRIESS
jgi:hypothetical protein